MKSVMYHYIQDFNPRMKYLSQINYKNFEKQIKFFKNSFDFIDCSKAKNFDADVNLNKKIFLTLPPVTIEQEQLFQCKLLILNDI